MKKIDEKRYHFMLKMYEENPDTHYMADFLKASELFITEGKEFRGFSTYQVFHLHVLTDPDMYLKYQNIIKPIGRKIVETYESLVMYKIKGFKVRPELSKFQILENPVKPVLTPWEQVNKTQNILIDQLSDAQEVVQFENIGNTSRKLLKQLADAVFVPEKHLAPSHVRLGSEDYKNKLHTYVLSEVGATKQNEEYMDCIDAIIETAEKSIALSNKLTHDAKGYRLMAESCVISVTTVVNMVKTIHTNKK